MTIHCDDKEVVANDSFIRFPDVNDEPPYFINRPQAVVQLNAPPNTPVFTLQARDPDTDHNIHYFIVRDRTGGRFEDPAWSELVELTCSNSTWSMCCM